MATVADVLVLAIDTSSAAVTAAVADLDAAGRGPVVARITVDARAHAERLAPSIQSCLAEVGAGPAQLGAVVAGLGPGPFTGLRVGLMTAAALADALTIPAYGVGSLDAIAHAVAQPGSLLVAGDARRHEIYWARYADGRRIEGPGVGRAADVVADASEPPPRMAGAGARLYLDVLGGELLDCDHPPAASLVALAADRVVAGAPSEILRPLYLRRPDAIEPSAYKTVTP